MTGLCRFEPLEGDAAGLCQRETVETLLDGRRYPAAQTYLWRFPPNRPIRLCFADGRLFCEVNLPAADLPQDDPNLLGAPVEATLSHFCAPDQYDGALSVDGAERWRWRWRVSGPRKNYHLAAIYQRA